MLPAEEFEKAFAAKKQQSMHPEQESSMVSLEFLEPPSLCIQKLPNVPCQVLLVLPQESPWTMLLTTNQP